MSPRHPCTARPPSCCRQHLGRGLKGDPAGLTGLSIVSSGTTYHLFAVQVPWPYYLINTRDSFTHHLVPLTTTVTRGRRTYNKTEYFFRCGCFEPSLGYFMQLEQQWEYG